MTIAVETLAGGGWSAESEKRRHRFYLGRVRVGRTLRPGQAGPWRETVLVRDLEV